MSTNHIIEVSEATFKNEVIAYSSQMPVVVDFWAEWCVPCRTLGPILEKLATEAQGAFRLAKVNVDENPKLAMHYQVNSIPSVKTFQAGEVVGEFLGLKPEPEVRQFLHKLAPSASELSLEKGHSLYNDGQWEAASTAFRDVLKGSPDHSQALLGLAKSLLAHGKSSDSLVILREFPASQEYSAAERLLPLAEVTANLALNELEINESPLSAAFVNTLKVAGNGNLLAAIDGLLDIIRDDKNHRAGETRRVILSMFEMLDPKDQELKKYRSELATLLF